MPGSLSDLYAALNTIAQSITNLTTTQNTIFPHVTGGSTTVPNTGNISFNSSQPVGFMTVTTSSGVSVKIPYFT